MNLWVTLSDQTATFNRLSEWLGGAVSCADATRHNEAQAGAPRRRLCASAVQELAYTFESGGLDFFVPS
jgi:hypothetical protein